MNDMSATEMESEAGRRASGSSFYHAMRIMPKSQREAMFEIYSFCRAVDDIADEPGPRDARMAQLQRWRDDLAAIYAGTPPRGLNGLARAVKQFDLRQPDFLAIIDGMEMDVVSTIRAPDMDTLDLYCDRVASAVGRLSVRVFGMAEAPGIALAHHLGRALQLTNILRDIDEDAGIGRLYLPKELLNAAGIQSTDPAVALASPRLNEVCQPLIVRAQKHFDEAEAIMAREPRRFVKTPRIMAAAYGMMLDQIILRGWQPPRAPIKLSKWQFGWILLRYAIV
jgi:phytoene synthase